MAEYLAMMISQRNVDFLKVDWAYLTGLQCSYFGKLLLRYTLHFEIIVLMLD